MIPLAQRLRELSDLEFESLVHQFLLIRFPGAGIRKVDGAGGDKGLDSFLGKLFDGPSIWQSKNFRQRIKTPQKVQILASIKSALKAYKPKRWTLCVPIDLRANEHEWFQANIVKCYEDCTQIDLISAADLLHELAANRILRDGFFPDNAITNVLAIRKIMTNSESASSHEQEQITVEAAQLFLERNIELEPRLEPVLSIGLSRPLLRNATPPGAVFSTRRGNLAIDYFPRDPKSYTFDPIAFHITLGCEHSNALEVALDSGTPVTLPAGALLKMDSSSPLFREFFQSEDCTKLMLEVRPSVPDEFARKEIPLRFVAGLAPNQIELPYVPFRMLPPGRKEITLTSNSKLPIQISVRLQGPPRHEASIRIQPQLAGGDMIDLATVVEFLSALENSGRLEVFTLEPPAPLLRQMTECSMNLNIPLEIRELIRDVAVIERFFSIPIRMPTRVSEEDRRSIHLLRLIATGEQFPLNELTLKVTKQSEYVEGFLKFLADPSTSIRLENPPNFRQIEIFGQLIDCGPVVLSTDEATALDRDDTRKQYLDAPEGADVTVRVSCKGPCRFLHPQNPLSASIEKGSVPTLQCS